MSKNTPVTGRRFFNITTINEHASPTSTQARVDNHASALALLTESVTRRSKHEAPIIRAFVYDTATQELRCYSVLGSIVTEVNL